MSKNQSKLHHKHPWRRGDQKKKLVLIFQRFFFIKIYFDAKTKRFHPIHHFSFSFSTSGFSQPRISIFKVPTYIEHSISIELFNLYLLIRRKYWSTSVTLDLLIWYVVHLCGCFETHWYKFHWHLTLWSLNKKLQQNINICV